MNLPSVLVLFVGGWGVAPNDTRNLFYSSQYSFLDEYVSAYPSLTIEHTAKSLSDTYKQFGAVNSEQKNLVQLLAGHEIRLIAIAGAERYGVLTTTLDSDQSIFDETNKHYCPVPPSLSLAERPESSLPLIVKKIESQLKYTKDAVIFATLESIQTSLRYKNQQVVKESIEQTNKYMKKIIQEALVGGMRILLIGDSSGAEAFGQEPSSQKTLLPVVFIAKDQEGLRASHHDYASDSVFPLSPSGSAQDIAATILSLMHIPKPEYIAGKNLFAESLL